MLSPRAGGGAAALSGISHEHKCHGGNLGNMGHEGVREILEGVLGNMGHEGVREIRGQVQATLPVDFHQKTTTNQPPTPRAKHKLHPTSQTLFTHMSTRQRPSLRHQQRNVPMAPTRFFIYAHLLNHKTTSMQQKSL